MEHQVACRNDIGVAEQYCRVAVGVCVFDMKDECLVTVDMKRHRIGKCYDGQGARAGVERGLRKHAFVHVIVGDDDRALTRHVFIATDVIAVAVRIDDKIDRATRNLSGGVH